MGIYRGSFTSLTSIIAIVASSIMHLIIDRDPLTLYMELPSLSPISSRCARFFHPPSIPGTRHPRDDIISIISSLLEFVATTYYGEASCGLIYKCTAQMMLPILMLQCFEGSKLYYYLCISIINNIHQRS